MLNEIRKDYLLNRWVAIATERKRRPTDYIRKEPSAQTADRSSCPFCPGNERMTPPAVLVYLKRKGCIVKEHDTDGLRHKDWLIRCVSNLYPAFSPPKKGEKNELGKAVGHHEVFVESPNHNEHPGVAETSQLIHVVNGYVDRLKALSSKPYVKYVSIFRNHGREAGASLSHTHSQIIATAVTPIVLSEELKTSKEFYETCGKCVFCEILQKEKGSSRFIWENQSFVAFAPWAAVNPLEFWIAPKAHQATLLDMDRKSVNDLADALKTCLAALKLLLNDPPYNYGFHITPNMEEAGKYYHWHLEIYPKLSIWAGFEKSTGMYINVVPPEDAAQDLRQVIENA
ncbi:MAG: galactose-1-phosphate uridylyltransferase [Candidatus Bathyarchaeia archaeon]